MTNPSWQQWQGYSAPHPPPPRRRRMGAWGWVAVALAVILVGVVGFIGYQLATEESPGADPTTPAPVATPGEGNGGAGGGEELRVVPFTSTFNHWLSDEYQHGIGEPWEAEGRVIGTDVDRSLVAVTGHDGGITVHHVRSGAIVHRADDLDCRRAGPAIDGMLYCLGAPTPPAAEGEAWITPIGAFDIATGAFDPFYNANFTVHEVAVFAVRDGLIYATTSSELGHVLLVFGDGQEIVWQVGATLPGLMDCHLLGDYVGCDDPTSFVVLDSATGDPVLSGEKGSGEYITWSDGGVVVAEHFADTYTVQLFAGGEEEHDEVPLNLNTLYPGTSLPLEHLFDEGVEFDSSGRAVVERDFFANLVFASTRERVPDEYKYGLEPSETGVVFLGDELLSDTNELLDNQGQVIASTPEQVHVIDGVLVVRSMDYPNLRVYPPAG